MGWGWKGKGCEVGVLGQIRFSSNKYTLPYLLRERRGRGRNLAALAHHENGEVATWQHKHSGETARSQLGSPKHPRETARSQLGSRSTPEKRRCRNLAAQTLQRNGEVEVATRQHKHSRETANGELATCQPSTPFTDCAPTWRAHQKAPCMKRLREPYWNLLMRGAGNQFATTTFLFFGYANERSRPESKDPLLYDVNSIFFFFND